MRIKPILFNTEMVQAILEGRKTQTRRIIKGLDTLNAYRAEPVKDACGEHKGWDFWYERYEDDPLYFGPGWVQTTYFIEDPYSIGDVLWVRETWDKAPESRSNLFHEVYYYRADGDLRPVSWQSNWHPSIHMPKEAARIFLKVKEVRVERLHDMDEEAAIAEGFTDSPAGTASPLERFTTLWDKTVKREDLRKYGYQANPWVWVIEFERCEKPKGW